MPNHIDRVGIELEGYWHVMRPDCKPDGSVTATCRSSCPEYGQHQHTAYQGELASNPLLISSFQKWVTESYPDHVDKSCGLHVHFSLLKTTDYARLTHEDFWEFFTRSWVKWGKDNKIQSTQFWERLRGDNHFCKADFVPHTQHLNTDKRGNRYSQLNFCYSLHKTIECRMLPMFKNKDISIKAIWHLISLVNVFLDAAPEVKWSYVEPVPPDYQDYVSDAEEFLDSLVVDNSFRSELDFSPYVPAGHDELSEEEEPQGQRIRNTSEFISLSAISRFLRDPIE